MTRVHLCETHTDMIRRVGALEGCGVRVKALEWKVAIGDEALCHDHWTTAALGGAYHMAPDEDSPGQWILQWTIRTDEFCLKYGGEITKHGSPEAAKSAAQADYEARILATLEPVAQPETPTPGQFTTMCLAIEDVVTGRGFDVDPWRRIQDDPPPKDGTKFLAYAKHAQVLNGEFQLTECQFSRGWWGLSPAHNWPASFTHWQPLTKPGETTSAIPEEVKAYLRNALMVGGWRGERE